jgi:hypothetical protein
LVYRESLRRDDAAMLSVAHAGVDVLIENLWVLPAEIAVAVGKNAPVAAMPAQPVPRGNYHVR